MTHDRRLLIAGLALVSAALVGGTVTGSGWGIHMGRWHGWMMGGWTGTSAGPSIAGAAEVEITATDFAFSPGEITVPAGEPVNLTFVNGGALAHDLVVADLGVHVAAGSGQSSTVGFTPTEPGRYSMVCTYPGHADAGMRGTLQVVEP